MSTSATRPQLLTTGEAAHVLRVHRSTIYRAVSRGELQALRLGTNGPLRVPLAAVEAYTRPAHSPDKAP